VTRTRGVAVLLLALTFTVGALAGMAIEEATGIDWFEFLDRDQDGVEDAKLMAGIRLTPAQRSTIDEILDRQEDELEDYWETRMPDIRAILARSYAEIRIQLDPAQQQTFDRRVRELDGRIPKEFRD